MHHPCRPEDVFRELLPPDFEIKDDAWSRIIGSGHLSARLNAVSTAADAIRLYEDAARAPQTETRTEELHAFNVKIESQMDVPHSQSAGFFYACAFLEY